MITSDLCEELLNYAKLPSKDFLKLNQSVKFSIDFNKENYSIFTVNKNILKSLEEKQNGDEIKILQIKGKLDEQSVLCTDDQTFELNEAETSNTLLIVSELELNVNEESRESGEFAFSTVNVLSSCNKIYELKERRAKIGEVYKILESSTLTHHIGDKFSVAERGTFTDKKLLKNVMMSDSELKDCIAKLKVYRYNDRLRLLHIDYVSDIIAKIIDSALEINGALDNISQKSVHTLIDFLYPSEIIDQTLTFYFNKIIEDQNGDVLWTLNDFEISKCFAEQILNKLNEINIEDFMIKWQKKLPVEISPSLSYLRGVALVNETVNPQTIKLLKSVILPDDADSRFKELFAHKSHWRQEDLEAYVQDLVPHNGTASQMLVRYCRCSNRGKEKVFSKR